MANPKITVVIPTRERCEVLEASLRTVTAQDYDNLEIIVSDNFSGDDTPNVVARANDPRIRYINPGRRLGMSSHWEFALAQVHTGWVTFLGDDDGLLPRALRTIAAAIAATGARAIGSRLCMYDWPGVMGRASGQLIVPLGSGIEMRPSKRWLRKVLRGHVRYNQLPSIYTGGLLDVSLVNEIKARLGNFFCSVNPDVFSSVAVARTTERYAFLRTPVFIGGTSRHSNGYSSFSTDKTRDPTEYAKFVDENHLPIHTDIPQAAKGGLPLSLQICAYEAYLQSAALGGNIDSINHDEQLVVALATSGRHRATVHAWGKRFAELHHLDFAVAERTAARQRIVLQTEAFLRKLAATLGSVVTERLPLRNIQEASIAAATARMRPSRSDTLRFLASQLGSRNRSA